MKRRSRKQLWDVLRPSQPLHSMLHAVPSSEAGFAVCTGPEDQLVTWTFGPKWHAEESAAFLASVESRVGH